MDSTPLAMAALVLLSILVVLVLVMGVALLRMRSSQPGRRRSLSNGTDDSIDHDVESAEESARVVAVARREAEAVRRDADRLRSEARDALELQARTFAQQRDELDRQQRVLAERERAVTAAEEQMSHQLAQLAGLNAEEARERFMKRVRHESRLQAGELAREIEAEARRSAEEKARRIIVEAIQRMAPERTAETVVSTVPLPGEDMKGRIIGREGRNIRAFEQVTGVNVMVDDTPDSVLLSSFDPVRREVGRLTLIDLIKDGRINPARIESAHRRNAAKIQSRCQEAGEQALAEMEITDLHPDLVPILGALAFRTSYGQNVLQHLVECGHLAALMASELGLDPVVCRRAAFLHDIGKAVTQDFHVSHASVGADLARRHGEHPDIVHAIEAHHNEIEPRTPEAVLTQAADAISGSRPGARRESLEAYVTRLERLEEMALAHEGVDRVFAMQAGREIRVMVQPDIVSDADAQLLAGEIARQVGKEFVTPGPIRVTVVRESRATEFAG